MSIRNILKSNYFKIWGLVGGANLGGGNSQLYSALETGITPMVLEEHMEY